MPQNCDRSAIIAETFCQVGGERIRTLPELAVAQPLVTADMRNGIRGCQSPLIDSFEEIHSKTLVNKWRRGEIAATVHHDQPRNNSKVIQNQ